MDNKKLIAGFGYQEGRISRNLLYFVLKMLLSD